MSSPIASHIGDFVCCLSEPIPKQTHLLFPLFLIKFGDELVVFGNDASVAAEIMQRRIAFDVQQRAIRFLLFDQILKLLEGEFGIVVLKHGHDESAALQIPEVDVHFLGGVEEELEESKMSFEEGDAQRRNLPTVRQVDVGACVEKQLYAEVPEEEEE